MTKLLFANFVRMWTSKVFRGGVIFMAFMGGILPINRYNYARRFEIVFFIDNTFFIGVIIGAIVLAVFCSLFVGAEYSDGTMRNKIVIGHSRIAIYLSNLITNAIAGCIFFTIYFTLNLCVGLFLHGTFAAKLEVIITLVVSVCMLFIAVSSIFTLIAMLNQNKSIVSITCILSVVALLLIGSYCFTRLNEPKMRPAYTSTNGSQVYEEDTPNPDYVGGTKRKVYGFIYNFLPGGQMIQFASMEISNPYILSLYSSIIILVTLGIGVPVFCKKDLK